MKTHRTTTITVEIEHGERGPIVNAAPFQGGRFEIVAAHYEVSTCDGVGDDDGRVEAIRVQGKPVRADGERKRSATYSVPVYGDEADAVAIEWLHRKIAR